METSAPVRRISFLDLAKGIGILLIVWSHANGPFSNSISQFRVPFFFLISGLLYNRKSSAIEFIRKKIFRLYLPFIFWNIFFHFFRVVLLHHNISWKQIALILLTIDKDGTFLGATWFLGALFVTSVLYKILDTTFPDGKEKSFLLPGCFCLIAMAGFQITLPYYMSRVLILSAYFAIGVFLKERSETTEKYLERRSFTVFLFSAVLFIFIIRNNSVSMKYNTYQYPILFFLSAFLGSYCLLFFCKQMDSCENPLVKRFSRFFCFLGKHSMDLVLWQFIAFCFVALFQMLLCHEVMSVSNILSHLPRYSTSGWWWIPYTLAGTFLPLLIGWLLRSGPWGKVLKKIHIV